jgi:hypothetical protein
MRPPITEQLRFQRVRIIADRRGKKVLKSHRRDPQAQDFGGYMVLDVESGRIVCGVRDGVAFQASLDEVEKYLGTSARTKTRTKPSAPPSPDAAANADALAP